MLNIADYYRRDEDAFEKGYERVNNLRTDRARIGAGNALAEGDYGRSATQLATAGLTNEAAQVARYGQLQEKDRREEQAASRKATAEYIGGMANRLLTLNEKGDDPARTVAAFDQYFAKGLADHGETPEEIEQLRTHLSSSPRDALMMLGAASAKEAGFDVKVVGNEALVFQNGQVVGRYGSNRPEWKEVTRQDGSTEFIDLNSYGQGEAPAGRPAAASPNLGGGASGAGGGVGGDRNQPRGMRNNNPLNLEATVDWRGMTGNDGRYATFASVEDGIAAADTNLRTYATRHGLRTIEGIISRWAPPSENDTAAYIKTVAQDLGVDPKAELNMADPRVRRQIIEAMAKVENGQPLTAGAGEARAAADQGGPRTVPGSAPKPPKARERRMTAEEVTAAGYQPGSVVMVNPETGEETVKQGPGAGSGKITDGMRNVASLTNDMLAANDQINTLAQGGVFRPTAQVMVSEKNGVTRLVARNPQDAQFVQAANAWLLPLLRKETGAAVTAPELATYMDTYIPLPSDDDDTIRQKADSRRRKMLSMLQQSRPAFEDQFGQAPESVTTYAPRRPKGRNSAAGGRGGSQGGGPPASAVEYLRANPNLRGAFDRKYGAGAAAKVLGR